MVGTPTRPLQPRLSGFHGSRTGLSLGDGADLSLDDMAGIFRGSLTNRTLHLGSCAVLAAADDELQSFVAESGAKALVGYTEDVGWRESASFECLLLPALLRGADLRALYKRMSAGHSAFVNSLGFRVVTRTFVSPRKPSSAAMHQE